MFVVKMFVVQSAEARMFWTTLSWLMTKGGKTADLT
jgi:hypothetical protein